VQVAVLEFIHGRLLWIGAGAASFDTTMLLTVQTLAREITSRHGVNKRSLLPLTVESKRADLIKQRHHHDQDDDDRYGDGSGHGAHAWSGAD
jgi:hypothetical protein